MRLPGILNQCHPIPGFVYGRATFAEEQSILIEVRPRKRSAAACSGCHQPAPGYDQSRTPRLFEFIGFWGYLVVLVYCMRRVDCNQCGVVVEEVPWGVGKHSSTKVYMHFLGIGRASCPGRKPPKSFALPGIRCTMRWPTWSPGGWNTGAWNFGSSKGSRTVGIPSGRVPPFLRPYYGLFCPCAPHRYSEPGGDHPLGSLPLHQSDRFPRSVQEPDPDSRRLRAGCRKSRTSGLRHCLSRSDHRPRFRHQLYAFGSSSTVCFRSSL
jgi:hypothetical protein